MLGFLLVVLFGGVFVFCGRYTHIRRTCKDPRFVLGFLLVLKLIVS